VFGQIRGQNFGTLTPYNFGTSYPNHIEFILKSTCEKQIFPMVKVSKRCGVRIGLTARYLHLFGETRSGNISEMDLYNLRD